MFKIDFTNKRVDFFGLATFAKKQKLNHKDCLKQAFDQNALIEDNKDLLLNFIESFDKIENFQSQLYQDICADFIAGDKCEKTFLEFGATDGLNLSNSYLIFFLENNRINPIKAMIGNNLISRTDSKKDAIGSNIQ